MYEGEMVFSQFLELVSWKSFQACVDRHRGDWKVKSFYCREFFRVMVFAQITGRESLSEIILCLKAVSHHLYHAGIRSTLSKSNLALANNQRSWKIFYDYAQVLIRQATPLYRHDPSELDVAGCVYALDSTTIDLCLSLFPWAHFRKTKAAVKMHMMINLQGKIPDFILISTGKMHDVNAMDHIIWEAGCWYVMDRGYLDFDRLYLIHQSQSWFVTRSKKNTQYQRVYSRRVDKSKGLIGDQKVRLTGTGMKKKYPELIRRIKYIDPETGKRLVFLTNNMTVSAETMAKLYKNRWHVELFFKWIKQHLHVKSFYGRSDNAVRSQLWISVCVYLLIAILKKQRELPQTLNEILHILSVTPFEKMPISSVFFDKITKIEPCSNPNQLTLFDL
jgi:transposase